jgi:hypothetical protein
MKENLVSNAFGKPNVLFPFLPQIALIPSGSEVWTLEACSRIRTQQKWVTRVTRPVLVGAN